MNLPRLSIFSLRFLSTSNLSGQGSLSRPIDKIPSIQNKMRGWQIHSYGSLDELQFSNKMKVPIIRSPNEVLVRVKAAGVNPFDLAMVGGYGSKLMNVLRCNSDGIEFPVTLGREFSGVVIRKGMGTCNKLEIGDEVMGVVPVQKPGSHSEFLITPDFCLVKKPKCLNWVEAAGLLYAGLTAWSGLFISGQLGGIAGAFSSSIGAGKGKKVLVLGGSGGVGSIAIQILRAEDAIVIASCSTNAIQLVKNLGAQHIIDYTDKEQINKFVEYGPYDIILDCAGFGPNYAEKIDWQFGNFVTFSSPLLKNVDDSGIALGMMKNVVDLVESNVKILSLKQGCVKWGYFIPAPQGIEYLKNLVERQKLLPQMDSIFPFENAKEAFEKVQNGHLRGKVVLDFDMHN